MTGLPDAARARRPRRGVHGRRGAARGPRGPLPPPRAAGGLPGGEDLPAAPRGPRREGAAHGVAESIPFGVELDVSEFIDVSYTLGLFEE